MTIDQMTVEKLKARLDRGDDLFLLDVRTPAEWQLCRLEGAALIPLNELPARFGELDRGRETVVYCRSGVRSQHAIAYLKQQGFTRLYNLSDGILAWAERIDPAMPRY
jgi:adenylyltransferase/sulfurtransferase